MRMLYSKHLTLILASGEMATWVSMNLSGGDSLTAVHCKVTPEHMIVGIIPTKTAFAAILVFPKLYGYEGVSCPDEMRTGEFCTHDGEMTVKKRGSPLRAPFKCPS